MNTGYNPQRNNRGQFLKGHIPWGVFNKGTYSRKIDPIKKAYALARAHAANVGAKRTPETRQRISQALTCRKLSPSHINNRTLSQSGSDNSSWKGGVSSLANRIRTSKAYEIWRGHVFNRDNYTCQACAVRGGKLHADHELPFAFYPDLRLEILNGRTLCVPCHKKTPTFKNHHNIYA